MCFIFCNFCVSKLKYILIGAPYHSAALRCTTGHFMASSTTVVAVSPYQWHFKMIPRFGSLLVHLIHFHSTVERVIHDLWCWGFLHRVEWAMPPSFQPFQAVSIRTIISSSSSTIPYHRSFLPATAQVSLLFSSREGVDRNETKC